MRLLVIGGAGLVGGLVLPALAERHDVRVLDVRPPAGDVPHVLGDVRDFDALSAAMRDTDAVLWLAMGPLAGWGEPANARTHFDVTVSGLYLALRAAREAGVVRFVYASSLSVFESVESGEREQAGYPEAAPPDATHFYGLAKRFGEQLCEAAARGGGPRVVALRLCFPTPVQAWPPADPFRRPIATAGPDVARAFLAALDYDGSPYEVVTISGDAEGRVTALGKARRLLGWTPQSPCPPP